MPQMDEILKNRKKKGFQKKAYRVWDLSGDSNVDDNSKAEEVLPETSEKNKANTMSENSDVILKNASPRKDKVIHNQGTNKGTDQGTIGYNKGTDQGTTGYNKGTDQGTKKGTIGYGLGYSQPPQQTGGKTVKPDIKNKGSVEYLLKTLVGAQAKIFYFLISKCTDNISDHNIIITTNEIITHCDYSYNTIKISLKRLVSKKLIIRNKGKTSRNGYLNLTLNNHIKDLGNIILSSKINDLNLGYELGYKPVHSSSYITTTKENKELLSNEWRAIDFEDIKAIGFSLTQIKQLVDKNEPELVQESIYHFAFGLQNNPQTQRYANEKKALNVLMGVLRKGQGWNEAGYVSPKEQAIKNLLEQKKAENKRIEKMEQELFSADFEGWLKKQDKQWLEDLIPLDMKKRESFRQATLRAYFKENVWKPMNTRPWRGSNNLAIIGMTRFRP